MLNLTHHGVICPTPMYKQSSILVVRLDCPLASNLEAAEVAPTHTNYMKYKTNAIPMCKTNWWICI